MLKEIVMTIKGCKEGLEQTECGVLYDMSGEICYHSDDKAQLIKWFNSHMKEDGWCLITDTPINPYTNFDTTSGKPFDRVYYMKRHLRCEKYHHVSMDFKMNEPISMTI